MELTVGILKQIAPRPTDPQRATTWDAHVSTLTSTDAKDLPERLTTSTAATTPMVALPSCQSATAGRLNRSCRRI